MSHLSTLTFTPLRPSWRSAPPTFSLSLLLLLLTLTASLITAAGADVRAVWIQLSVDASTGPAPLGVCDHSAVVDDVGYRLLVTGGELADSVSSIHGVWALNFADSFEAPSWENLTDTTAVAPPPRSGLSGALQQPPTASATGGSGGNSSGAFIVSGGIDLLSSDLYNDTWSAAIGAEDSSGDAGLDGFEWLPLASDTASDVTPMSWAYMAWGDDWQTQLLMYGGTRGDTGEDSSDLWLLDFTQSNPQWVNISALTSGDIPPKMSGMRLQWDSPRQQLIMCGGYSCTEAGLSGASQNGCFTNAVYLLSMAPASLYTWRLAFDPASEALAPTPRAWHTTVLLGDQLWVFGGSYIDTAKDSVYFNDVWVWDLVSEQWTQVLVSGRPPPVSWSMSGSLVRSREDGVWHMIVYGGCPGVLFYGDVYGLKLNTAVAAANCEVFGSGVSNVTAGHTTWFAIQTRALVAPYNGTGAVPWGAPLTWGGGLQFAVVVIGRVGAFTEPVDSTLDDLGDGLYNVSFTAQGGGQARCAPGGADTAADQPTILVTAHLEGVPLPGSPFVVPIYPDVLVPASTRLLSDALDAVKGQQASFMLEPADTFGNTASSPVDTARFAVTVDGSAPAGLSIASSLEGTVSVNYTTPSVASYTLVVTMDGVVVPSFPLTVAPLSNLDVSFALQTTVTVLSTVVCVAIIAGLVTVYLLRSPPRVQGGQPSLPVPHPPGLPRLRQQRPRARRHRRLVLLPALQRLLVAAVHRLRPRPLCPDGAHVAHRQDLQCEAYQKADHHRPAAAGAGRAGGVGRGGVQPRVAGGGSAAAGRLPVVVQRAGALRGLLQYTFDRRLVPNHVRSESRQPHSLSAHRTASSHTLVSQALPSLCVS